MLILLKLINLDVIFCNNFFTDFREGGYNRRLSASKIIKLFINLICELIVSGFMHCVSSPTNCGAQFA